MNGEMTPGFSVALCVTLMLIMLPFIVGLLANLGHPPEYDPTATYCIAIAYVGALWMKVVTDVYT